MTDPDIEAEIKSKEQRIDGFAARALEGMLAHPTRYKPRDQDRELHWHDAISKEAFEIARAMEDARTLREKSQR